MDREQEELQFLGFFGVCKESINIIFSWSKIFTKLTLILIIPLCCIILANDGISTFISSKITDNKTALDYIPEGSPAYNKISSMISSERTTFWLIKIVYLIFLFIFSLLSTAAIVYTIACVYTGKEISFRKIMSVVPKVWKRLIVTFLWIIGIMFAYNFVWLIIIISAFHLWFILFYPKGALVGNIGSSILLIIYLIGISYISVIWRLACVVSVLEDTYGIQAMMKSKNLIKGKMGISTTVFLVSTFCLAGIKKLFEHSEVIDWTIGIVGKIGYGILCFVLLTFLFLFGHVAHTVIYFVCKSYHHENIDKSTLADHLDAYLGEYVPLNSESIQLEEYHV